MKEKVFNLVHWERIALTLAFWLSVKAGLNALSVVCLALLAVGELVMRKLPRMNFEDITESLAHAATAFLLGMPLMYIVITIRAYILCKLDNGKNESALWYNRTCAAVASVAFLLIHICGDAEKSLVIISSVAVYAINALAVILFITHKWTNHAPLNGSTSRMWLYFTLAACVFAYTKASPFLDEHLPKPVYLFLQFAGIVGMLGAPAFFIGEMIPRERLNGEKPPFKCMKWENDGKIYEKIGIRWLKKHTPDMSKSMEGTFAKQGNLMRDPDHMLRLVRETCSAELVHAVLIVFSPVFIFGMDSFGWLGTALYVVGNLPSLLIQRYNRPRIQGILDRLNKRKSK